VLLGNVKYACQGHCYGFHMLTMCLLCLAMCVLYRSWRLLGSYIFACSTAQACFASRSSTLSRRVFSLPFTHAYTCAQQTLITHYALGVEACIQHQCLHAVAYRCTIGGDCFVSIVVICPAEPSGSSLCATSRIARCSNSAAHLACFARRQWRAAEHLDERSPDPRAAHDEPDVHVLACGHLFRRKDGR